MNLHFIYNLSILFNVVTGGVAALFLLFTAYRTNRLARVLTHLAIADVGWAFSHLVAQITEDPDASLLFNKWSVFFTIIIGFYGFDFSVRAIQSVTGKMHIVWYRIGQVLQYFFITLITCDIIWNTGLLINQENYGRAWGAIWPGRGLFFNFFPVYFIGSFIVSYFLLSRTLSLPGITKDSRKQIGYFNISLFAASFGGMPYWLNWYDIYIIPLGGLLIPLYIFGLFYSITKFKLFNIRVITAELSTIVIWMVTLSHTLISEDESEFFLNLGIFVLTLLFGLLTIRSVIAEVKQRDSLEQLTKELDHANKNLADLNSNLEAKVSTQTKEIRTAYEVEKKARIELEELDKAKDQFILTTQHHLRTPLTIVKGFVELALDEKEANQNVKTYLGKADDAVERMSGLISDLLNVSQVEIGKIKPQPVALRGVVEEMRSELLPVIESKGISFSIIFSPEAERAKIAADKKIIKAALYNLVDNAIKYTSKGGITVHGEVIKSADSRIPFLKVDIADTGMGIDEKDLPLIFNRFFERGSDAEKINISGKGVGLALSKRIIESHGGMASVSSPGRGKGSTFTVRFPIIVG